MKHRRHPQRQGSDSLRVPVSERAFGLDRAGQREDDRLGGVPLLDQPLHPQQRPAAGHQHLALRERFGDELVRPMLPGGHLILGRPEIGDHHHRDEARFGIVLELAANVIAGQVRQVEVEEDQVGPLADDGVEDVEAVVNDLDVEPIGGEVGVQERGNGRVVVHDQDPRSADRLGCHERSPAMGAQAVTHLNCRSPVKRCQGPPPLQLGDAGRRRRGRYRRFWNRRAIKSDNSSACS
ncbi:MAG: hypothetical protein U0736_14380 [Gemmataceae bacterium]